MHAIPLLDRNSKVALALAIAAAGAGAVTATLRQSEAKAKAKGGQSKGGHVGAILGPYWDIFEQS